jgi:hypothetical protein
MREPFRGTAPALAKVVQLEDVFRYRTLLGKCELGFGLEWEEIEEISALERTFAPRETRRGRKFRRAQVELVGIMRGDKINDRVAIVELGPGGLVCRHAPFVARGEQVEIVIDRPGFAGPRSTADGGCGGLIEDGERSYRFSAQGVWLKDDGDDYRIGLALIGMPVCLTRHAISRHEADLVDRIGGVAVAA